MGLFFSVLDRVSQRAEAWADGLRCRRCGHVRADHRHYRASLDCWRCGCIAFRLGAPRFVDADGPVLRRRP